MADLKEIGKQAKAARYILAGLDTDTKNKALFTAAECLEADAADILAENAKDLEAGRSRSMPEGLLDRLSLTQKRISDMAEGLRQGRCASRSGRRDSGYLHPSKRSCHQQTPCSPRRHRNHLRIPSQRDGRCVRSVL